MTTFMITCSHCGAEFEGTKHQSKHARRKSSKQYCSKTCRDLNNGMRRTGLSRTPTHNSWRAMKERCDNRSNKKYADYGGREIGYSDEWKLFEVFLNDMGLRPEGTELDRIDVNKNYCRANCRWITHQQNCQNRRNGLRFTYNGTTLSIVEWAVVFNLPEGTLRQRLAKCGWPIEKALTTPLRKRNRHP